MPYSYSHSNSNSDYYYGPHDTYPHDAHAHAHAHAQPRPNQDRKRQRRQAAGALVSTLFGGGGGGSASAANTLNGSITTTTATTTVAVPRQSPTTPSGKKSTAQPRPCIRIPPRGIGPVYDPNINDVLCGRGGRINAHTGNVQFRDLVQSRKKDYLAKETKKLEKAHIAAGIVRQIREMDPSGRFLKEDGDGCWYDIGMLWHVICVMFCVCGC